ncbi:DVU_1557 family redox protein [Desulfovibrio sp. MES5]|uniref:DVU_1557 family redox protein n=1 Tax=Desulfovibrio sp. MES5 TaxID=1899016 RepID=UPI0026A19011
MPHEGKTELVPPQRRKGCNRRVHAPDIFQNLVYGKADLSDNLICHVCNVLLQQVKTNFSSLRHTFSAEVPRCPQCSMVYLPESLVCDRMIPVEQLLEDK